MERAKPRSAPFRYVLSVFALLRAVRRERAEGASYPEILGGYLAAFREGGRFEVNLRRHHWLFLDAHSNFTARQSQPHPVFFRPYREYPAETLPIRVFARAEGTPSAEDTALIRNYGLQGFVPLGDSSDQIAVRVEGTPPEFGRAIVRAARQDLTASILLVSWEGLRPSTHYGHAYLEAARAAVQRLAEKTGVSTETATEPLKRTSDVAVILHLYYPELAPEFAEALRGLDDYDLYVSVTDEISATELGFVRKALPSARIFRLENRGRDVYPFWTILARLNGLGYKQFLKLHSKKSPNSPNGEAWRRALLRSLTDPEKTRTLRERMNRGEVAIACPAEYRYPYGPHIGLNHPRVAQLLKKLGARVDRTSQFAAGTMFWIRADAAEKLLELGISKADFEEENGQIDGTLAHALERVIPIFVESYSGRPLEGI